MCVYKYSTKRFFKVLTKNILVIALLAKFLICHGNMVATYIGHVSSHRVLNDLAMPTYRIIKHISLTIYLISSSQMQGMNGFKMTTIRPEMALFAILPVG